MQARKDLVDDGHLVFQRASQRSDLLDPNMIQTQVIAMLIYLTEHLGYDIEITALRSDHHDDSDLSPNGVGTHAHGWGVDCWPLSDDNPGNYMVQDTHPFRQFLWDAAHGPFLLQIGLGGAAYNQGDIEAAGSTAFEDSASDHVHIGCH